MSRRTRSHAYAFAVSALFLLRLTCCFAVAYGLFWQFTHPVIAELDRKRFGGSFEFLTVISACATVALMVYGLVATFIRSARTTHMHWVAFLLPVETLITVFSWIMYIGYQDRMFSPDIAKFNSDSIFDVIHVCLHLFPFVGLTADFVAHMEEYAYSAKQGVALLGLGLAYLAWLVSLRFINGRWTYYVLESFSLLHFVLIFVGCHILMYAVWLLEIFVAMRAVVSRKLSSLSPV